MDGEIIVALCSLAGTFAGTLGGVKLMTFRIQQLEKKVEKHNNLVERMAVAENRLSVSEHRIADLEKHERGDGT